MAKARILFLPMKAEYFDQIVTGEKPEEYREVTPYWAARLDGPSFRYIEISKGYPPRGDAIRRSRREWRGVVRKTVTHPHFGSVPVEVFAIDVSQSLALPKAEQAVSR